MKRRTLTITFLSVWLLAGLLTTSAHAQQHLFDPVRFKLDNGLEVWVQSRPRTPTVALRLMVRTGASYETAENNGISHFVEHMLFTGTQQWDEAEIKAVVDRLGGRWNGWTGYETTCYWIDVRREYAPQAMEWLAQIVAHPSLSADEVEDERQVIIQEQGGEFGPVFHLLERLGFGYDLDGAIRAALFPGSALGLNIGGTETSVASVDHAALVDFYNSYYVPDNMVLIVVGDLSSDEVSDLARTYLGGMPSGASSLARPPAPAPFGGPASIRMRGPGVNDQAQLSVGYRTVDAGHPDRYALEVAAEVLGFRLDESVRYERGLVYRIGSFNATFSDAGYFQVWTFSEGKNLAEIQPLIEAELERLRAEPVAPDDLVRAHQVLNGRRALWLETNGAQADYLADLAMWLPPGQAVPDDFAGIEAVTAADVQRVAQTHFVPQNGYTAVYRPAVTLTGAAVGVGLAVALVVILLLIHRWQRRRVRARQLVQPYPSGKELQDEPGTQATLP